MIINFSVILNTFERETQLSDLKKCLKSIFDQSIKPKEVIVVHSGNKKFQSTKFQKYINKIKIINCPKKTNISKARNIGANKSKNNFLAFIDDDDLWGKNYLKNSKIFIRKTGALTVLSIVYVTSLDNKKVLFRKPKSLDLKDYFDINIGAMGSNLIIKKKEFNLVRGFDTKLTVSEDKGIVMDLILKKRKIYFQKNNVWYNLRTPNSVTKQPEKMIDGLTAFLKKYKRYMSFSNRLFILKKIFSYKKKLNSFFYIHFLLFFILNKVLN
tara:strand:+ start:15930 stop:16736 length:807 start_codon:yes stop_codon:yes gene_type:complete